jgi:hypothetical protein
VLPDKGAGIVVYCMNVGCEASALEARELAGMGYANNVYHYVGASKIGSVPAFPRRAGAAPGTSHAR